MTEKQTAVFGKTPMWDMVDWEDLYKPEESALLVIDPQNDILKKEGNMDYYGMWQDAPRTIEAIGALVRGARARKVPVFWFRYVRLANGKDVFPNSLVSARLKMLRSRIPNIFADGSGAEAADVFGDAIHQSQAGADDVGRVVHRDHLLPVVGPAIHVLRV